MARFYAELNDFHRRFIGEQQIFFVATAPADGRVNLSPKGMDTFRCIDERTVAYLDLTGSGNETAAHLQENGRITVMFCSFSEVPLILRIYGIGRRVLPGESGWDENAALFDILPGTRQIFRITVDSVQTSCGHAVPFFEMQAPRTQLVEWAEEKGDEWLEGYRQEKNRVSIDGRPTEW